MRTLAWAVLAGCGLFAVQGSAQLLTPVWIEVGEDGVALARVVAATSSDCPAINIDGSTSRMTLRTPVPPGFAPACESTIPANARSANVNGQVLALPKADPSRIAVIGDTGCRVAHGQVQDCNDPAQWPLPRVADRVASAHPELVIHVGDYLYREIPCPADQQALCGGTPAGDRWETWNADFFAPASALLRAAPWALARGNHEDCGRSWRGWFYYLDPHPWSGETCQPFQPPYRIRLGSFHLVVFDTSAVTDNLPASEIARYAAALGALHEDHAWLVSHHPFWGFKTLEGSTQPAIPGLTEAWRKASPHGIDLIVSGHVHLFELLGFDHKVPPQLVSGDGGTGLSTAIQAPLRGMHLENAKVLAGVSERQFGYTLLTKFAGHWNASLNSIEDRVLAACVIEARAVSCH
ncbi:MAG: metallophosphoesterase [Acidobacteriia bacterium]|nr:metallophosphoesterase [Terriglobia bacterium]